MKLSCDKIISFMGDVVPLWIVADGDENTDEKMWVTSITDVKWSVDSDAISFRSFENEEKREISFSDGILLRLDKVGKAVVTAEVEGKTFSCSVTVTEIHTASPDEDFNYYRGDLHTHTTPLHDREKYYARDEFFQNEHVKFLKDENLLDFGVLSDHADIVGSYEFYRGYVETEKQKPMEIILFPGSESENTVIEKDRYGYEHKNSGEMVMLNCDYLKSAYSWEEYTAAFTNSTAPVGIFAHPQTMSKSMGNRSYKFAKIFNLYPEMRRIMRLLEIRNGVMRDSSLLYEYSYSDALDAGFRISPTSGSDGHRERGFKIGKSKTILMAREKTKESFTDAMLHNRVYASESANLKIRYSVNGHFAPADLPLTDKYEFHIELSYFEDDPSTHPVKCEVISDYGKSLRLLENVDSSVLDFEVESASARYFYLRFVDSEGRRTWSTPMWCSRPFDVYKEPSVTPIDKSGFTAYDEVNGKTADAVVNDEPMLPYESNCTTASIVIDMKEKREVSAVGHYTPRKYFTEKTEYPSFQARYVRKYRISASTDGENYTVCAEGGIRMFGGEEIISFPSVSARFIKFEALTTVGKECELPEYADATVSIGELSIFI